MLFGERVVKRAGFSNWSKWFQEELLQNLELNLNEIKFNSPKHIFATFDAVYFYILTIFKFTLTYLYPN